MSEFAKDYIEVHERIAAFYKKHPEGSLQSELVELTDSRVVMRAYAYRTAEDARPGIGYSSLEIPGKTPYTRGSEIENTETSAWGRAIAALGFEVKRGIASADEIRSKAGVKSAGESPDNRNGTETEEMMGRVTRRGMIRAGTSAQYQLAVRPGPAGPAFGFKLEVDSDKAIPQCVVEGDLAKAILAVFPDPSKLIGTPATVKGLLYHVKIAGKQGSWYRLHVDRFENADWIFPADENEPVEAPTAPLFDDEEAARIAAAIEKVPVA